MNFSNKDLGIASDRSVAENFFKLQSNYLALKNSLRCYSRYSKKGFSLWVYKSQYSRNKMPGTYRRTPGAHCNEPQRGRTL